MKLVKDGVIRELTNDFEIQIFKENGWVEVVEEKKTTKKTTKKED